jgi:hypothetical protein
MSLLKKKNKSNILYGSTGGNSNITLTPNTWSNTSSYGTSSAISISPSSWNTMIGTMQQQKTYLECDDMYLKIKLKTGEEIDILVKDYIKYPFRMGKELEDSTIEEYNEWKMVNEL